MRFRTRLFVAISLATVLTLSASFASVSFVVEHSEERELDEALKAEAREEAIEIAAAAELKLQISDRPGPEADDVGRLTKYGVLYGPNGVIADKTPTFHSAPPPLSALPHPIGTPFDLRVEGESTRAVLHHVPNHPDLVLLLGATREELERDMRFLREVMLVAALVSLGWIVLVSFTIARGLTRDHAAIARAARRVSDGDLTARVGLHTSDEETSRLAGDVDRMIERLELLALSQQRFVAHAAHELRSPLTAFYGELQLALRRKRTPEEYEAAIQHALGSARDLKRLADDLLVLARLGADGHAPLESTEIGDIIDHALGWQRDRASARGVELDVDVPKARVLARSLDIERLIGNLVDNALRFAPPKTAIRIRGAIVDNMLTLEVADEGPGISDADRDRIFDPFFRGSREQHEASGSGLGLSIARSVARAHGGDLVLGKSAKGAVFTVTLKSAAE